MCGGGMAILVHRRSRSRACRFHRCLTVKFRTWAEAADSTTALQDICLDRSGNKADIIHKGAKAQRPAKVKRFGVDLAPAYKELGMALVVGEALEQARRQGGAVHYRPLVAVD